jgi:hypothetical protein
MKRLPLGNSDFKKVRTENYFYVDKTRYIELLENENNSSQLFIRPRRFGKSLFLSTLSYYYDNNYANEFDQLFGDLYIGKHPTPKRNSYAVMNFDFSGLNALEGADTFITSFYEKIHNSIRKFLNIHTGIFPEVREKIKQIDRKPPNLSILDWAFEVAQSADIKIFIIIDEYDHFATDLAKLGVVGGNDFYTAMVKSNGLVRSFYARIKSATTSSIVDRTFITGISPVMLDDLTSGYNISSNYSLNKKYNEMLGFTREEVTLVMEAAGVDSGLINVDMEYYYNGYLFNEDATEKVYNSSMILYFFDQILQTGKPPQNLIDPNLGMDLGRLRHLVHQENNRNILVKILTDGSVVSRIITNFSTDQLNSGDYYFVSLLFYLGYLTIKESYIDKLRLVIPNYSIQTVYGGYMRQLIQDSSPETSVSENELNETIISLAMQGDIHCFIDYVSRNVFQKLSVYDLQRFDEKYIKILLLAYLFLTDIYITISESEVDSGRMDIFLQRNPLFPEVKYEWVLELKYCQTRAKAAAIAKARKEGLEQLNQYIKSHHLKNRPNLKTALIILIGKNKYDIIIDHHNKK